VKTPEKLSLNYHNVVTHKSPGLPAPGLPWEKSPTQKNPAAPTGCKASARELEKIRELKDYIEHRKYNSYDPFRAG
jgi:hypothetical protein